MDMAVILFNDAKHLNKFAIPFRQKAPCEIWWKLLKQFQRKRLLTNYTSLYMYLAQGQGQITLKGQDFDYY